MRFSRLRGRAVRRAFLTQLGLGRLRSCDVFPSRKLCRFNPSRQSRTAASVISQPSGRLLLPFRCPSPRSSAQGQTNLITFRCRPSVWRLVVRSDQECARVGACMNPGSSSHQAVFSSSCSRLIQGDAAQRTKSVAAAPRQRNRRDRGTWTRIPSHLAL